MTSDPHEPDRTPAGGEDLLPRTSRRVLHWSVLGIEDILIGIVALLAVVTVGALIWSLAGQSDCPGCETPVDRVGIGKTSDGTATTVWFIPCGDETVSRVWIADRQRGTVLWEAVAPEPARQTTFIVGQLDEPFEETVALADGLPVGDLAVVLESERTHQLHFARFDLLTGYVFWNGLNWTPDEFSQEVRTDGACEAWNPRLTGPAGKVLLGAIVILAIAVAGLFATRYGSSEELHP